MRWRCRRLVVAMGAVAAYRHSMATSLAAVHRGRGLHYTPPQILSELHGFSLSVSLVLICASVRTFAPPHLRTAHSTPTSNTP